MIEELTPRGPHPSQRTKRLLCTARSKEEQTTFRPSPSTELPNVVTILDSVI